MAHLTKARSLACLGALTLAGAMGGCSSMPEFLGGTSKNISFNNVCDSPLNVTYFVRATMPPVGWKGTPEEWNGTGTFMADRTFQVDRGETVTYRLKWNNTNDTQPATHIRVQPVGPSWVSTSAEYWLEVLTAPPVNIVATGVADDLTFNCGSGAIAVIPEREIEAGRFDHRVVTVTNENNPE